MSKKRIFGKSSDGEGDVVAKKRRDYFNGIGEAFENARKSLFPKSLMKILTYFFMGALGAALAFAKLPFETYPLGIALICGAERYLYTIFVGTAIGSLFSNEPVLQLVFCALCFALRIAIYFFVYPKSSGKKRFFDIYFNENIYTRIMLCAIILLSLSITRVIKNGFIYYDLFAGLFCVLCGVLATCVYWLYFDKAKEKGYFHEVGFYALLVSLVIAFGEVYLYSLSLNIAVAFFITLYISKNCGMLRGAVIGLLCGVVCSPVLAPLFALCGFISGMFWATGSFSAVLVSITVGSAYGFYIDGLAAFSTLLPELIISGSLFLFVSYISLLPKAPKILQREGLNMQTGDVIEKREKDSIEKIQSLSQSLFSLSDIFYNISTTTSKPASYDIKQLCDNVWQESCKTCSMWSVCWEKEYYSTADAINKLAKELMENGRIMRCDIEENIEKRCKNIEKIISEINVASARLFESCAKRDKTEIFAFDYNSMAKILENHINENAAKYNIDKILTERMRKRLSEIDFTFSDVAVYGERHKSIGIYGLDMKNKEVTNYEILKIAKEICQQEFSAPEYKIIGNNTQMTLKCEKKISVEYAVCGGIKENEKISGDTFGALYDNDGNFYSFICDGMGSGSQAAFTSRICKVFLEKMLSVGVDLNLTLEMLNNFLRNKNTECCATADIIKIDLAYASAEFIKCGAAESYICRKGNIFKIASTTPPIGIMREIDMQSSDFELQSGDIIILQSDGANLENNSMEILLDIMQNNEETDVEKIANGIYSAVEKANKHNDDTTVSVIKII